MKSFGCSWVVSFQCIISYFLRGEFGANGFGGGDVFLVMLARRAQTHFCMNVGTNERNENTSIAGMPAHTHTRTRTRTRNTRNTRKDAQMHRCTDALTCARADHARTHTCTHAHMHTCTRARTHARTHARTQKYLQACTQKACWWLGSLLGLAKKPGNEEWFAWTDSCEARSYSR